MTRVLAVTAAAVAGAGAVAVAVAVAVAGEKQGGSLRASSHWLRQR